MHAWHVVKMKFVTLLSTKVLNSLEKIVAGMELVMEWYNTIQPFTLPVNSYSGFCSSRLSLNTAWQSQSLLEAS